MALVAHTTNVGLQNLIAALVSGTAITLYAELGTNTTAATVNDTGNGTPDTTTGRVLCTLSQVTGTQTGDTIQAVANFSGISVNETVTEIAIYTAASGGHCVFHETGYSQAVGPANGSTAINTTSNIQLQTV